MILLCFKNSVTWLGVITLGFIRHFAGGDNFVVYAVTLLVVFMLPLLACDKSMVYAFLLLA